jgi:hypothetical protein
VLISVCLAQAANASISISQEVDRTEMAFEDTATFRIIVTWPGPAHAYLFERPIRLQSDLLKVARFSSTVSTEGNGPDEVTTKVFRYRLVPVLSGPAEVEAATVDYLSWPDSTAGQLSSDPFVITVAEPLPFEEEDLTRFSGGLVALIVVALMGVGVGLYAAFKPKPVKEKKKSPREAFLDGLARVKTTAGSDLKQFQTGLYQLLAEYLKARYGIDAVGRPAAPAVAELEKIEPISSVSETLSGWLVRAEREKFTPLASAPGEVMRLESEVRAFFEKMK